MAAFLVPDGGDGAETDPSELPTEPVPIPKPQPIDLSDLDGEDCVLCLWDFERQFGRPVDGVHYDSSQLNICPYHLRLHMMARNEELDLMHATVELLRLRYQAQPRL